MKNIDIQLVSGFKLVFNDEQVNFEELNKCVTTKDYVDIEFKDNNNVQNRVIIYSKNIEMIKEYSMDANKE